MNFSTFTPILLMVAVAVASPLDITAREPVLPPTDNWFQTSCSTCNNLKGDLRYLYPTGKCETLPTGEQFYNCVKPYNCGICMVFQDEQCKRFDMYFFGEQLLTLIGFGDMIPFGARGWDAALLKGSKSYFCLDG
jgi:hypothetical protein